MRIYILSDTHGLFWSTSMAELLQKEKPDMVFHCGDGYREMSDLEHILSCPVYRVRGNCDMEGANHLTVEAEGHRILCLHGHQADAAYGLGGLDEWAEREHADIVLFGHTHIPEQRFYHGRWFINPGSLCRSRGGSLNGYAVLHLYGKDVYPQRFLINGGFSE